MLEATESASGGLGFRPNSNSTGHGLPPCPACKFKQKGESQGTEKGNGVARFTQVTRLCVGHTSPAGGPQKQQKQSTPGAKQKVSSFCPAWMGNLGRPPEVVRRRKGTERAKAWKLAHGA